MLGGEQQLVFVEQDVGKVVFELLLGFLLAIDEGCGCGVEPGEVHRLAIERKAEGLGQLFQVGHDDHLWLMLAATVGSTRTSKPANGG